MNCKFATAAGLVEKVANSNEGEIRSRFLVNSHNDVAF